MVPWVAVETVTWVVTLEKRVIKTLGYWLCRGYIGLYWAICSVYWWFICLWVLG